MKHATGRGPKVAVSLLVLLAAACAGGSREQLARIDRVGKAADAAPPAVPQGARLSLGELIERAQSAAPAALATEIRTITDQAAFDQEASAGLPRIGVDADYGRGVTVRRDESALLNVAPSLSWDVIRMLQMGRIKRLRVQSEEASEAQRALGRDQIALEVTRRYAELEAARTSAAALQIRANNAAAQARIAALQNVLDPAVDALAATAETLAGQAAAARGRERIAENRIDSLCGTASGAAAAPYEPGAALADPLPLGDYLQSIVAASQGLKLAALQSRLAEERARLTAAQRWSLFRLSSSAGNVLDLLSATPLAMLNWTYGLIDQGDFNRQLVRARADAVLARLNTREEADRLLDTGGRVWLALLDAAAERKRARETLRQARLGQRIAAAQSEAGVATPEAMLEADSALAAAEADLRLRELDVLIADTQYRLLAGLDPRTA